MTDQESVDPHLANHSLSCNLLLQLKIRLALETQVKSVRTLLSLLTVRSMATPAEHGAFVSTILTGFVAVPF